MHLQPNRQRIVELLRDGPLTVGEIAERLHLLHCLRRPKHLRILSESGLVEAEAAANRRIYKLRAQPFQDLEGWLDSFQRVWHDRLDRLDDYLQELKDNEKKGQTWVNK